MQSFSFILVKFFIFKIDKLLNIKSVVLKVYKCTRLNTLFFLILTHYLFRDLTRSSTDKWIKTFRQMVLPVMLVKVTRSVVLAMEIINGSTTHKSLIRGADCDWGACQHKVGTIYTEVKWRPLHRGQTTTFTGLYYLCPAQFQLQWHVSKSKLITV